MRTAQRNVWVFLALLIASGQEQETGSVAAQAMRTGPPARAAVYWGEADDAHNVEPTPEARIISLEPVDQNQTVRVKVASQPVVDKTEVQPNESVSSTPTWVGAVLRMEFVFPERRALTLGTGFVIKDRD